MYVCANLTRRGGRFKWGRDLASDGAWAEDLLTRRRGDVALLAGLRSRFSEGCDL